MASLLFTFLLISPAAAQVSALDDPSLGGGNRYDNCLSLSRKAPQRALDAALVWEKAGGGGAASHCAALSLVSLRRYPEAAARLDALARTASGAADRAELYDQAGNAWLLARRADNAQISFTTAIGLKPREADLLADRARAFALKPDWQAANTDLTSALAVAPLRTDLLILRSSALHALGKKAEARADIDQALKLKPGDPEALELRGEMKAEAGDQQGAQADWKAVTVQWPTSAAARDAQQRLDAANTAPPTPPKKP